jgi:hypothetical protein
VLVWAGVASFLYHASLTPHAQSLDMISVWTLVSVIIPYLVVNHMFAIKRIPYYGNRIIGALSCAGMLCSYIWPFYGRHYFKPGLVVPLGAGCHFALIVTYYVVGWGIQGRVKVRKNTDLWLLFAATASMGVAYYCQKDQKFCKEGKEAVLWGGPDSWFQGHALWHSGMAIGVMFFYFFMRQERAVENYDPEIWVTRKEDEEGEGEGEGELMISVHGVL